MNSCAAAQPSWVDQKQITLGPDRSKMRSGLKGN
jgi:hypothetical protein